MDNIKTIAFWLTVIGALNWGLVALLKINLVTIILGEGSLPMIVYLLIGASAVFVGYGTINGDCFCKKKKK